MNKQDLKNNLLTAIGKKIAERGFSEKPSGQSFYKQTADHRMAFHLAFIMHPDDFDVTASISIRFDDVENMVNADNTLLTAKEKKLTNTLGVELGNLSEGRTKRWNVATENDISKSVEEIISYFDRYAIPYLAKYSNRDSAFDALSKLDKSSWMHLPLHGARAERVVALAVLLGMNERIEEIIKEQKTYLEYLNDFGLPHFVSFIKTTREQKILPHS